MAPSARAQLIAGDSPQREHRFTGSDPTWLRVGSGPDADWRLHGDGIAPAHCELLWDGQGLYLQDRWRLGGTLMDGQRVDGWQSVAGDTLVYLGSACLRLLAPRDQADEPGAEALRWVQDQLLSRHGRIRAT